MSETASTPSPRRRALSHSGCGCCGNIFAEGVGRHGNNRDSGCVRAIRGTADRRCCLISVHHRYLDVHQDDVIGSGREGEDLNMSTAICPFSAQLTDNPCVLSSARGPPRAGRCIHGVGQFLNIFGGAEIPFGNDGYGLFLEAIAFCLELDRFFALL